MPESKKINVRLGDLEEKLLEKIKIYLGTFLEKDPKKITDTEAINFAIRSTKNWISQDETVQGTKL